MNSSLPSDPAARPPSSGDHATPAAGDASSTGGAATAPTGTPTADAGPAAGFFDAMRRTGVVRSDDRWIGGVAGGLAERFGIDPLLTRGIFAASILFGGLGLVLYGVAWALLPEQRDGRIHLQETLRGAFDVAIIGALAFVVVGLSVGNRWVWWWTPPGFGWIWTLGWIATVALAIVVGIALINGRRRDAAARRDGGAPEGPGGPSGPGGPFGPGGTGSPAPPAAGFGPGEATPAVPTAPVHPTTSASPAAPTSPADPTASAFVAPATYAATSSLPQAPGPGAPVPPAARPPRPPREPRPPRPPRPRPQGPGSAAVGIVVGLAVLGTAGLMIADRLELLDARVIPLAVAGSVVLLGAGIVVSGLRGRTSGVLGFLAIVGIIVGFPIAWGADRAWSWRSADGHLIGTTDVAWTSRDDAADGFWLGAGEATVDLSAVELTDEPLVVPVRVVAGDVTIVVPPDAALRAEVSTMDATLFWDVDGRAAQPLHVSGSRTFLSDEVSPDDPALLVLTVDVGAGDITIEESR